jgi:hypothetical protein
MVRSTNVGSVRTPSGATSSSSTASFDQSAPSCVRSCSLMAGHESAARNAGRRRGRRAALPMSVFKGEADVFEKARLGLQIARSRSRGIYS